MDEYAKWVGYAAMVAGGFALSTMLITIAGDALWQRLKQAYTLVRIMRVMERDARERAARSGDAP